MEERRTCLARRVEKKLEMASSASAVNCHTPQADQSIQTGSAPCT